MIKNPILKGFHPDPNILRVGEDYFIATSTFQWYPGVEIHRSRDLENWELATRPLNRKRYLDMTGEAPGCGVWAPQLSYWAGEFFLVYSDCKTFGSIHNYLVTASDISGPWSDPIYLCSGAFDLSLFHEGNKKYLLMCEHDGRIMANMANLINILPSYRGLKSIVKAIGSGNKKVLQPFQGIALVAYNHQTKRIVGERKVIFKGSALGATEGPHLYKRNGYYYLMTAEGGTGYGHAVSLARSKTLHGPYEMHPSNPILTAKGTNSLLKRAGHGSIVETQHGETYMAYLCSRPLKKKKGSILGRESALMKMEWKKDWLYAKSSTPLMEVERPKGIVSTPVTKSTRYTFEQGLPEDFQWLRNEENGKLLQADESGLTITGREWIDSRFNQGLAAVRMTDHDFVCETKLTFQADNFHQTAGLAAFYSTDLYLYFSVGCEGKLQLRKCKNRNEHVLWQGQVEDSEIRLKMKVEDGQASFFYGTGETEKQVYKKLDISFLSDETSKPYGFTGAFVALCCQDLSGKDKQAKFHYLTMENKGEINGEGKNY